MDAAIAAGSREYVCVAATHTVMASREDPELRAAVLGSSLTVPDGQPLVWALRAYGHRARRPRLRADADGPGVRARRADAARGSSSTADATTTSRRSRTSSGG